MKKSGNYIKITLHRIKVCADIQVSSYNLKISFGKQTHETDKITLKEIDYGGKSFFFDLSPGSKQSSIEISAMSKTLFIFDSHIAKVTIPFALNKFDDKREWYYLKNQKEENMVGILISIYCELKPDLSINIETIKNINAITLNSNNNSYLISKSAYNVNVDKRDSSYDANTNKSKNAITNMINKSQNNSYNNIQRILVNNSLDDLRKNEKNKDAFIKPDEDDCFILENTILCGENYKSPNLSTFSNNMFSPTSYRKDQEKSQINYNLMNLSNLNSKLNTSNYNYNKTAFIGDNFNDLPLNNNFSNVDSFSDLKYFEDTGDYGQIINKLKIKATQLQDEQERLRKLNEDILKNREKIRQKEGVLIREKEKLESYIKNFKINQTEFEKKTNKFNENFSKFNNELNKFSLEREIFDFEKKVFLNVNLYSSIGKILDNNSPHEIQDEGYMKQKGSNMEYNSKNKIAALNNDYSNKMINISNTTISTINNAGPISSYNTEKKKKDIVYEKPSVNLRKGENERESFSRKESQGSLKLNLEREPAKVIRSLTNNNVLYNLGTQLDFQGISSNEMKDNTINNMSYYTKEKESKFFPPVAQIDLNYKRKNPSLNNESCFDILSTKIDKSIFPEANKLIDSLDNFSLMYSSKAAISNIVDKKDFNTSSNSNRGLVPGSVNDEQKSVSKKSDDGKRKLVTQKSHHNEPLQISTAQNISNINNIVVNANFNCGLTSNSTILMKEKKLSSGAVTKFDKPQKSTNNTTNNYNSNKTDYYGLIRVNLNQSSIKKDSNKKLKG